MRPPTDDEILRYLVAMASIVIQELGPAVSLGACLVFCCVAMQPGISQTEVADQCGMSKYAVHRAVKTLSTFCVLTLDGGADDSRRKRIVLRKRGEKLRASLMIESRRRIIAARKAAGRH